MIRFDHISKKYPGTSRPALNDVDFEVLRGEFVFLVGASGSGKSTCLRLMLKEDKPSKGKIHVLGHDLGSISNRKVPYFRRSLGVVFQDFRLLPGKTVSENVAFTLQVIGKSRGFVQEAVPDVLKMVGLEGKAQRLPHELSGGEQQRVAIARAIVNKPQILLADEPTGNLDPATSAGIMQLLERINAGGTTVVMATHEAGFVDQMQRRVIELVDGSIVRDEREGGYGTTAAIPNVSRGSTTKSAKKDLKAAAAASKAGSSGKAGKLSISNRAAAPAPVRDETADPAVAAAVGSAAAAIAAAAAATVSASASEATTDDARKAVDETPVAETAQPAEPASSSFEQPSTGTSDAASVDSATLSGSGPAAEPLSASASEPDIDPLSALFEGSEEVAPVATAGASATAEQDAREAAGELTWAPEPEPQTVAAPESAAADSEAPSEQHADDEASDAEEQDSPAADAQPTLVQRIAAATGPIGIPPMNQVDPAENEHLSLAERLGLRAAGRPVEDGEQNVGPTK